MKNALKEKFKNNMLVKPLYKRLNNYNKIKPTMFISVSNIELDGFGTKIKSDDIGHGAEVLELNNSKKKIFICGRCESLNKINIFDKLRKGNAINYGLKRLKMVNTVAKTEVDDKVADNRNKFIQTDDDKDIPPKVPCTWLRVYPLPQSPGETIGSVFLRCTFCQFGLATFLVIWTTIWVFVIHYFEEPAEINMYYEFEKQQHQVVIDLATELRQIAPLSHRWKAAIEKRIEEVIQMTLAAVLRGARLRPGQYWDLSGTFLFTIYIMTALGFGAPVPRTIEGRSAVLVYASLAIPVHFYLMMNAGMCIVVHSQAYVKRLSSRLRNHRKSDLENESPNCSRHSEVLKAPSRCCLGLKIMRCLGVLNACHCVPLAVVLYYLTGACVFGKLQDRDILKTLMFPLEFTASGGLEHQPGNLRILYAFYVEGAMMLLACAVVTFRRYSTPSILWASQKYRLFTTEE